MQRADDAENPEHEDEPPRRAAARRARASGLALDPRALAWTLVPVCMHCLAVVFVELPGGRRLWLPGKSEAATTLRAGAAGGPAPRPSHGICPACVRIHHPELVAELRAQFPDAGY